ncbi:hypothetical protein L226DRAFT_22313 [Lentinus tigrinus ALCF2SS1-7]|uniref:uncharacterized protein n=1 Tax=Lentinus tigrinus ALCF2SS1-7 TaxID=1328758 RepID=UPI001165DB86|nr:hypothetical protein L226DRAFT_22313 [Lentinus tigrinus ALCF2SS1-7]
MQSPQSLCLECQGRSLLLRVATVARLEGKHPQLALIPAASLLAVHITLFPFSTGLQVERSAVRAWIFSTC